MRNDQNNALKSGLWYISGNIIQQAVSFLTTPIFTRLLTTSEYGIVSTYTSYASLLTLIATLNIWTCIQVSRLDFNDDNDQFVSSIFTLSAGAVFICYLAVKFLDGLGIQIFMLPAGLTDVMFLEVFFTDAYNILLVQCRSYYRYRQATVMTIVMVCISVGMSFLLVAFLEDNLYYGRIIGNACAVAIVGLYSAIYIWGRGKCLYNKLYWKYALLFAVPLIPNSIASNVLSGFDRIMITNLVGSDRTAIYSLGYTCCNVLLIFSSSLDSAWCPWFFDKMASGEVERIRNAFRMILLLFIYICAAAITVAPELIFILGGAEYRDSKWVIPPVILGICFLFMCTTYCNILHYRKKTKGIVFGTALAAVLNVILNWILIPTFGYLVAAYTTLLGYAIQLIYDVILVRYYDKRDIFDGRFVLAVFLCMTVYSIAAVEMYQLPVFIRYVVFAIITSVLLMKYRQKLQKLWNQYIAGK